MILVLFFSYQPSCGMRYLSLSVPLNLKGFIMRTMYICSCNCNVSKILAPVFTLKFEMKESLCMYDGMLP